jgi:ADP-ribose pyrophosphatase YjhB (NUDIX family)
MVRYRDVSMYDNQRGWFLPDDYLQPFEHPDEAAKRILRDQVGITPPAIRLDHAESFGNGWWHLVFHYRSEIDDVAPLNTDENVADAQWFALEALPEESEVAHDGWGVDVIHTVLAPAD